jgi:hypothetical protein
MLLTDVWDACDYMAAEPPTHVLLAQFLGYKGTDRRAQSAAQQSSTQMGALLHMPKMLSKPQPAPDWMKNSPSLKKLAQEMLNAAG